MMKKLLFSQETMHRHWVGDGFPVRTIFSYNDPNGATAQDISPFLLMDYAGPENFRPADHARGVGEHPHRGFETVTVIYDGEVEHRDSAGGGGRIGPGDIQWMTAASGVVHEEMHGKSFSREGGRFEMVQLWVNLPARDKMSKPGYQSIKDAQVPRISLADEAGFVRVIAGEFNGSKGPARTFTPVNLWDVRLKANHRAEFVVPVGHTALVFVLSGRVALGSGESFGEGEIAFLDREGDRFVLNATEDSKVLFLGGERIDEPVVGQGPFVMNTTQEIEQCFIDYHKGLLGRIPPAEASD